MVLKGFRPPAPLRGIWEAPSMRGRVSPQGVLPEAANINKTSRTVINPAGNDHPCNSDRMANSPTSAQGLTKKKGEAGWETANEDGWKQELRRPSCYRLLVA